jgi:hypothetical protein
MCNVMCPSQATDSDSHLGDLSWTSDSDDQARASRDDGLGRYRQTADVDGRSGPGGELD